MCGICGYNGVLEDGLDYLAFMLESNETRGRDATGIGYFEPANKLFKWLKDDIPAAKFVNKYLAKSEGLNTNNAFGHTRAATSGRSRYNFNNHPFVEGHYALIHNGIISNDVKLAKEHNFKMQGDCDSEIIVHMINKVGISKTIDALDGWFALAIIDLQEAGSVTLIRDDHSPLFIGRLNKDCILYSSIKEVLVELGAKNTYELSPYKWHKYKNGKLIGKGTFENAKKKSEEKTSRYWGAAYKGYNDWHSWGTRYDDGVCKARVYNAKTNVWEDYEREKDMRHCHPAQQKFKGDKIVYGYNTFTPIANKKYVYFRGKYYEKLTDGDLVCTSTEPHRDIPVNTIVWVEGQEYKVNSDYSLSKRDIYEFEDDCYC